MSPMLLITLMVLQSNYITEHFQLYFMGELLGEAKGGVLYLVEEEWGSTCHMCSFRTAPHQSGSDVAGLLVEALHASPYPGWQMAICDGARFYLPEGVFWLAGTETGFATRRAPRFATINYSRELDRLTVNWMPEEQEPEERVQISSALLDGILMRSGVAIFDKFSTTVRYDLLTESHTTPNLQNMAFCIGRSRSPFRRAPMLDSRYTRIHVSGSKQEDLDNLPFYGNVGPNWEAWCAAGFQEGQPVLCQGEKSEVPEKERKRAFASSPDTKFYCQMFEIKDGVAAEGGIYRRYLGLLPGHTYRVFARFNTFESKGDAGDWSLSFYACADPAGQGLTVAQLAGRDALPNGTTGNEAGRVAFFNNGGETTQGSWLQVCTGTPSCADITIPEGSTSLSAWVRVKGSTASRFGMDWSALEDVTPGQ